MSTLTRREFINTSAIAAGTIACSTAYSAEEAKKPSHADVVDLGKTGIKVTRLAQGTGMRGGGRQSNHTRLGQEAFTDLILHGYNNGIHFFDMADMYGSQPFIKNALKDIPREKYVLLSKIWFRPGLDNNEPERAIPNVERFLKELGTDMIDIVLIHCASSPRWPEEQKKMRDELSELKQKGTIRAHGVSCHSLEALKAAAELPWVDVILARINNQKKVMDGDTETVAEVLKTAKKNGKGIIGMKIYGEGQIKDPALRFESMKYVVTNKLVDSMTIGHEKKEHVDESIKSLNTILQG